MDNNEAKKPMHVLVAERVIEGLRAGTAPWQRPWDSKNISTLLPYNLQSGKRYKGINAISLLTTAREDPRWMTYRQAEESGFQVRKGEKSTLIQFVKTTHEHTKRDASGKVMHDELGNPLKIESKLSKPIVRNAYVFNAAQVDGLPELKVEQENPAWNPSLRIEKLIASSGANIHHEYTQEAYYNPAKDAITLPYKDWFSESSRYYATLLHELGHWTGHPERLNRVMGKAFGDEMYAREELRAEIASMILGQEMGIGHDPGHHFSYVESWIAILENNPFEIFSAALDAERISSFILDIEKKQEILKESQISNDQGTASLKIPEFLTTGDKIPYNGSLYEILGHLKQGRLKVYESHFGTAFTMSREDKLYTSLLSQKKALTIQESELIALGEMPKEDNSHSFKEINR